MADDPYPACAGPDPNPHPPATPLPPQSCDTHAHVFGPVSRYAYSTRRGYTPPDASLADWLRLQATLGIERGVLTQPSVYGTDNTAILDAVAARPERLRAVAALGETVDDDTLANLDSRGVRGVRVNIVDKGGMPFADMAAVARMGERILDLGWHLEFLAHVDDFPDLHAYVSRAAVPVVFGHLGYMPTSRGLGDPGFQALLDLVRDHRAWVKLSGAYRVTAEQHPPYDDVAPFAHALVEAAPEQILWGTDWPHPIAKVPMPNDGDLLDMFLQWIPDPALRHQILVDNPATLYGFDQEHVGNP